MISTSSQKELKSELETRSQKELINFCLTLSKFKKENKEYLTYLLFETGNDDLFIAKVKSEMDDAFSGLNSEKNIYFTKKSLRKILRSVKRYNRYASNDAISTELLIYYCRKLKESGIPFQKSPVLFKLYNNLVYKIRDLVAEMHEDLQFDYRREIEFLSL